MHAYSLRILCRNVIIYFVQNYGNYAVVKKSKECFGRQQNWKPSDQRNFWRKIPQKLWIYHWNNSSCMLFINFYWNSFLDTLSSYFQTASKFRVKSAIISYINLYLHKEVLKSFHSDQEMSNHQILFSQIWWTGSSWEFVRISECQNARMPECVHGIP